MRIVLPVVYAFGVADRTPGEGEHFYRSSKYCHSHLSHERNVDSEVERLRSLTHFKSLRTNDPISLDPTYMRFNVTYVTDGHTLSQTVPGKRPGQFPPYLIEDLKVLGALALKFRIQLGDTYTRLRQPTLVKARFVDDSNSILYPINIKRHYPEEMFCDMRKHDLPLEQKTNRLVWRGGTTGRDSSAVRFRLVETNWGPDIDVAFSSIVQGESNYTVSPMHWSEIIKFKFILSVEGNDVSSGLKWQLFSNSVILMPPPTKETWLLESHLVPYGHYIPIRPDLSDLQSQFQWARTQSDAYLQGIATNATRYISRVYENSVLDRSERLRVLRVAFGLPLPGYL